MKEKSKDSRSWSRNREMSPLSLAHCWKRPKSSCLKLKSASISWWVKSTKARIKLKSWPMKFKVWNSNCNPWNLKLIKMLKTSNLKSKNFRSNCKSHRIVWNKARERPQIEKQNLMRRSQGWGRRSKIYSNSLNSLWQTPDPKFKTYKPESHSSRKIIKSSSPPYKTNTHAISKSGSKIWKASYKR